MTDYQTGATSQSVDVLFVDDSGLPLTGKVAADFPTLVMSQAGAFADVAFPSLTDLATITTAWASGGVKERGNGVYRVDCPNAGFSGGHAATLRGEASGKHIIVLGQFNGVAYDPQNVTNLGLACLPGVVPGVSTGFVINGNNSGSITLAGPLVITNALTLQNGLNIHCSTTGQPGIYVQGGNTSPGMIVRGGTGGAAQDGVQFIGSNGGHDVSLLGDGTITSGANRVALNSDFLSLSVVTAGVVDQTLSGHTTAGTVGGTLNGILTGIGSIGPGLGAFSCTVKVTSDGSTPIVGASVRISGAQQGLLTSDSGGNTVFSLNAGTVTLSITAGGYSYGSTQQTVDGSGHWSNATSTLTVTMTANPAIVPSANPALTNCFFKVYTSLGTPVVGAIFTFELEDAQRITDAFTTANAPQATSDSNGVVQISLPISMSFKLRGPDNGAPVRFTTSNQGTTLLPEYVGNF